MDKIITTLAVLAISYTLSATYKTENDLTVTHQLPKVTENSAITLVKTFKTAFKDLTNNTKNLLSKDTIDITVAENKKTPKQSVK